MRAFLAAQIGEIRESPLLRLLGIALVVTNFFALYHFLWSDGDGALVDAMSNQLPVCWPFFEGCRSLRPWFAANYETFALWWGGISAVAAAFFLFRGTVGVAYGLSAVALVMKYAIILQDYTLMGNFHYISLVAWISFFLVPGKLASHRLLLVTVYFCAGLVKLNSEWISGSILAQQLTPLPNLAFALGSETTRKVLANFNILLELFLVFLLLARNRAPFTAGVALFTAFHLASWPVVGRTFPGTMLSLLIPLWALALWPRAFRRGLIEAGPRRAAFVLPVAVLALQIPSLVADRDPALSGEARIWAVNMLDSHPTCDSFYLLRSPAGDWVDFSGLRSEQGPRIQCDPIVAIEVLEGFCLRFSPDDVRDMDVALYSRRSHETAARPVFEVRSFCANPVRFNPFFKNDWIRL